MIDAIEVSKAIVLIEKSAVLAPELYKHLKWVLQSVHQGHHTEQPGTWATCDMGVCKSSQPIMSLAGETLRD